MRHPLMLVLAATLLTTSHGALSAETPLSKCAKAFVKAEAVAQRTLDQATLKVCKGSAEAAELGAKVAAKTNKARDKANTTIKELPTTGTSECDPDIQGQLLLPQLLDGEAAINERLVALCNTDCDSGDCGPPPCLQANFFLDGNQEVPAVVTAAAGSGVVVLDTVLNTLTYDISFTGITDETMAHIHGFAAAGSEADVLFNLPTGTPKQGSVNYSEVQESDIIAGLTYVNIHTAANTGGEIRGQVQPFELCD